MTVIDVNHPLYRATDDDAENSNIAPHLRSHRPDAVLFPLLLFSMKVIPHLNVLPNPGTT